MLGALVALLTGCSTVAHRSTAVTPSSVIGVGDTVFDVSQRHALPTVTGTTLSGHDLDLRTLAGRGVLVINVWASWCETCRAESAALASLAAADGSTATFVGIDEQDNAAAARTFVAATGTSYPQLSDPEGTALNKLSALPNFGIPSTLVIDPEGRMAARIVGALTRPRLERLIDQIRTES